MAGECMCPGVCVSKVVLLFHHSQGSLSLSASFCEDDNTGESPFSPRGGADDGEEVLGQLDKGVLC